MAEEQETLTGKLAQLRDSGWLSAEEFSQLSSASASQPGQATDSPSDTLASAAPSTPATEILEPHQNSGGGVVAIPPEPTDEPGTALGENAPGLETLQNKLCPNCHTGVLYVTRYDPEALHEQGQEIWVQNQPRSLPPGWESGGAYDVECRSCGWTHSFAMNPGKNYGKAR